MAGLDLLFGDDLLQAFPPGAQASTDPEWQLLADKIQEYRDELVRLGTSDEAILPIDALDYLFKCERIPLRLLQYVAESLDARVTPGLTERQIRQRICGAMVEHRAHATIDQVKDFIFEITGFVPDILWTVDNPPGWDANNTVTSPTYEVDYFGGIFWHGNNAYDATYPVFIWQCRRQGLFVDIMNLGAYTVAQLNEIYALIAELKVPYTYVQVGYFNPAKVILTTIYSTDLTMTEWLILDDPGIDG